MSVMLKLNFGALAPKLSEQLIDAGVSASVVDRKQWQKDADAITRLYVRSLIADSTALDARKKLMRKIISEVKKP